MPTDDQLRADVGGQSVRINQRLRAIEAAQRDEAEQLRGLREQVESCAAMLGVAHAWTGPTNTLSGP